MESKFSERLVLGALTTTIKSCSAFGPSFKVMRFVNSLETGFSMNQDSYLTSLLTTESVCFLSASNSLSLKGRSGVPNLSSIDFLLYFKVAASTDSSTIYSKLVRFPTLNVEPSIFPGKN
jgi:hypothetical protein